MRRVITGITATTAAACCLLAATPALADYVGAGVNPASGGQFPATTAAAPAAPETPVAPLFAIGAGVVLVGAGGLTLARRRSV